MVWETINKTTTMAWDTMALTPSGLVTKFSLNTLIELFIYILTLPTTMFKNVGLSDDDDDDILPSKVDLREEIRQDIIQEVRQDIIQEVRQDIIQEVSKDIIQEVSKEVRQELTQEITEEVMDMINQDTIDQLRQELRGEMYIEVWDNLHNELWIEVKQEIHQMEHHSIKALIEQEMHQEVVDSLRVTLTPQVDSELRSELLASTHNNLTAQVVELQGRLEAEVVRDLRLELTSKVTQDIIDKFNASEEMRCIRTKAKALARLEFRTKQKEDFKAQIEIDINNKALDEYNDAVWNHTNELVLATAQSWGVDGWMSWGGDEKEWQESTAHMVDKAREWHLNRTSSES